ncbi:hypothetical protein GN956_G9635 [Arapaima gigas]
MSGSVKKSGGSSGFMDWISAAYHFSTDRNDFRRNLLVNLGFRVPEHTRIVLTGDEDGKRLSPGKHPYKAAPLF